LALIWPRVDMNKGPNADRFARNREISEGEIVKKISIFDIVAMASAAALAGIAVYVAVHFIIKFR
jgi:hypothetical protein